MHAFVDRKILFAQEPFAIVILTGSQEDLNTKRALQTQTDK